MKKLTLALLLASVATPAFAVELNPDTGFDTPSAWTLDPASSNLWTVSGSKANGNGAKAMQMLMGMNAAIKRGHTYRWSLTVSSMTTGVLEVGIGPTMTGTVTGTWKNTISSVADNFTTANGIGAGIVPGASVDQVGAFRIFCDTGNPDGTDPVVYPNMSGRSHLHTPWGNSNSLDVRGNYNFYRTTGGTTCGNMDSQRSPINRSAYWMPSMLDGIGNVVLPLDINLYYKAYPSSGPECTNPANSSYVLGAGGTCAGLPTGLVMIGGYNFSTGLGGPADNGAGQWSCKGAGTWAPGVTQHLSDLMHGGCALRGQGGNAAGVGGVIEFTFVMPTCWDGVHIDSPNHRDHVGYAPTGTPGPYGKCDYAHPNHITVPQPQVFWMIDANFVAGKWHLSSDEMVSGKVSGDPGGTMHMDFTEAWSPTARTTWMTNCVNAHNSCATGNLGDGTTIKDGGSIASTHGPGDPDQMYLGTSTPPKDRYFPTAKVGIGKPITANGTYSGEIVANADGRFGLIAVEDGTGAGFNGQVDNLSIAEVPSGHTGSGVTIHN